MWSIQPNHCKFFNIVNWYYFHVYDTVSKAILNRKYLAPKSFNGTRNRDLSLFLIYIQLTKYNEIKWKSRVKNVTEDSFDISTSPDFAVFAYPIFPLISFKVFYFSFNKCMFFNTKSRQNWGHKHLLDLRQQMKNPGLTKANGKMNPDFNGDRISASFSFPVFLQCLRNTTVSNN